MSASGALYCPCFTRKTEIGSSKVAKNSSFHHPLLHPTSWRPARLRLMRTRSSYWRLQKITYLPTGSETPRRRSLSMLLVAALATSLQRSLLMLVASPSTTRDARCTGPGLLGMVVSLTVIDRCLLGFRRSSPLLKTPSNVLTASSLWKRIQRRLAAQRRQVLKYYIFLI
ncbi:hypothetical protein MA16_Dca001693 [Dendrobium catenatum]|uniref:Uncharacterized protein n=1 Tax=Dendrobium catenatum TaxID=906689 RepID=A0A2I0WN56_9ASPA|nr:hypothetical protein MA16_Dca001693 [Dendrobium catenatum]